MQVSVESVSNVIKKMTVIVPVEKLDEAYGKRIANLSKTAKVKGFRAGKVPTNIIQQQFGETARQEALSEVIQSSLYAAMSQEKLTPVGVPTVEPKNITPGQPLEFVATFEVLPTVGAVKFELNAVEKIVSTITDADIDRVLEHLRGQHTSWKKVDRAAQDKDQATIDFEGMMEGKPFEGGQAHEYPIVVGSKMMIPGFEDGLVGMKAGETKNIPVTFPENYFAKEFAGKPAEFKVKMIKVSEPNLPALDDAFAKKLGVKSGSIDDLKAEVRKNLERELSRLIQARLKTQVFGKLLEQNPIDVPNSLIEREANRLHNELHPHHAGHEHHHTDAEMQGFKDAAKQNVILGILVGELVRKHDIMPNKERVNQFITNMSASYENPEEVKKWYQSNKRQMAEVEMRVLEEQLLEKLLENITVTEKTLSYEEFVKTVK